MKRTSIGRRLERRRRGAPSRSSSTRRSLACIDERHARRPRRGTPCRRAALSRRPALRRVAPVNAPFSWPNSSLSSSVSDSAAQLRRRNGPLGAARALWTASASTSLPTPVSPRMSTLMSLEAMRATTHAAPHGAGRAAGLRAASAGRCRRWRARAGHAPRLLPGSAPRRTRCFAPRSASWVSQARDDELHVLGVGSSSSTSCRGPSAGPRPPGAPSWPALPRSPTRGTTVAGDAQQREGGVIARSAVALLFQAQLEIAVGQEAAGRGGAPTLHHHDDAAQVEDVAGRHLDGLPGQDPLRSDAGRKPAAEIGDAHRRTHREDGVPRGDRSDSSITRSQAASLPMVTWPDSGRCWVLKRPSPATNRRKRLGSLRALSFRTFGNQTPGPGILGEKTARVQRLPRADLGDQVGAPTTRHQPSRSSVAEAVARRSSAAGCSHDSTSTSGPETTSPLRTSAASAWIWTASRRRGSAPGTDIGARSLRPSARASRRSSRAAAASSGSAFTPKSALPVCR